VQPTRTGAHRPARALPWKVVTLRHAMTIAFAAAVFILVSFLVARWLTAENRERDAVTDVLRAQAAGDAPAMIAALDGCATDPACRAAAARNARVLKRPGTVQILSFKSSTGYAVGSAAGPTRVAWNTGGTSLPVVQCVTVERTGIAFLAGQIRLRSIGPKIGGLASCPA